MHSCVKPNSHVKSLSMFLEPFQFEFFGISSSAASMNFPRAYFSLLTIGDAFVAIGGVTNNGYTAEVEAFFNYTKAWRPQYSDLNLDTARSSFATLLLPSSPSEYAGPSRILSDLDSMPHVATKTNSGCWRMCYICHLSSRPDE